MGGDACSCGGSGHGWGTLHSFPGGSAQRPLQEAPASPADSEFHPGVPAAGRWGPALGRSRVSCTEAQGQRSALCGHAAPAIGAGARRPRGPLLPVRVLSEAEGTVASRGWGTGHGSSLRARSDVPTACARRGASPLTPHSLGPTCSNGGDAGDPRSTVGAKSDEWGVQPLLAGHRHAVAGVLHGACWGLGWGPAGDKGHAGVGVSQLDTGSTLRNKAIIRLVV